MDLINLKGQRFGSLLVMRRAKNYRPKGTFWYCKCDCGKHSTVESWSLRHQTRSCGCGRKVSHFIHGRGRHGGGRKSDQGYVMLHGAKHRAVAKGLDFNLDFKDVVIPALCPVLGIPLFRGKRGMADNCPSLDRVIPSKGYVKGNVRVISFRANRLKSDAEIWELEKVLRYMKREAKHVSQRQ